MLDGFQRRGLSTGFMKPVGQRTIIEDGVPADEDAVLMQQRLRAAPSRSRQMSPVHIPRGFTKAYIEGEVVEDLPARIRAAHAAFAADRDILLIEGTGHAGVGAVIGLSNARGRGDARRAGGHRLRGRRRPADRRDRAQRRRSSSATACTVAGAIVNKVDLDAKPGLARTLERGLARHGIPLLGVLPYRPILSNPTLAMVLEGVHGETIHAGPGPRPGHRRRRDRGDGARAHARADRAAQPGHRAGRPRGRDPEPLTSARAGRRRRSTEGTAGLAGHGALGLVLTGGYRPRDQADPRRDPPRDLFATLVPEDTYVVASEVHDLLSRPIRPTPARSRRSRRWSGSTCSSIATGVARSAVRRRRFRSRRS